MDRPISLILLINITTVAAFFNDEPLHRRAAILHLLAHPETHWWDWTFIEFGGEEHGVKVATSPTTEQVRCN
jgi:hypothetical protein